MQLRLACLLLTRASVLIHQAPTPSAGVSQSHIPIRRVTLQRSHPEKTLLASMSGKHATNSTNSSLISIGDRTPDHAGLIRDPVRQSALSTEHRILNLSARQTIRANICVIPYT